MILLDTIAHHKKFLLAGQQIGGNAGASRALAMYVAAIGYAREGLTDGVVHDAFLDTFPLDSEPIKVATALSARRVRLFHRIKGGYKIHDFHDHNGTADKLRHQRDLARERKRRQRAKQPADTPSLHEARHAVTAHVTRDTPRDSRARDLEKETEYVRTAAALRSGASSVRSGAPPVEVPTGVQRPHGRDPVSGVTLSAEQTHDLARVPAADDNYAVLVRLAHTVMDAEHTTDPTSPDLIEAVKCAAAARHIKYHHETFNRALRSAGAQRAQVSPLQPLVDVMRQAVTTRTVPDVVQRLARMPRR